MTTFGEAIPYLCRYCDKDKTADGCPIATQRERLIKGECIDSCIDGVPVETTLTTVVVGGVTYDSIRENEIKTAIEAQKQSPK